MRKHEKEIKETCKQIEKKYKDVKCKYEYDDLDEEWEIVYSVDKDDSKFYDFIDKIVDYLESRNIEVSIYCDETAFEESKTASIA